MKQERECSWPPAARVVSDHGGFVCKGCGKVLRAEGFCDKCGAEIEALKSLWDFEEHRRPRQPVGPWTPGTVAAAVLAITLGVYLVNVFAPMVADWICGGPQ